MPSTLDLYNQTLALIGERAISTSTGSMGSLVKNAITTALYKVIGETRASTFEQFLTFTATNDDYLIPIGNIPPSVVQFNKVQYRSVGQNALFTLQFQQLELLSYTYSYSVVGANLYLSPLFKRPITLFASALVVPSLPADDQPSPVPDFLVGAIVHTAAAILCVSYLDDGNAAALQRNLAQELIGSVRLQFGANRAKSFNMGGWVL